MRGCPLYSLLFRPLSTLLSLLSLHSPLPTTLLSTLLSPGLASPLNSTPLHSSPSLSFPVLLPSPVSTPTFLISLLPLFSLLSSTLFYPLSALSISLHSSTPLCSSPQNSLRYSFPLHSSPKTTTVTKIATPGVPSLCLLTLLAPEQKTRLQKRQLRGSHPQGHFRHSQVQT